MGEAHSVCEIILTDPAYEDFACFPLPASVAEEMFCDEPATSQPNASVGGVANDGVVVKVENHAFGVHTELFISFRSWSGLLYDCLRTLNDRNSKVAHGRIPNVGVGLQSGNSELCLLVVDALGRKITDAQELQLLVQCMEEAVRNPVRIKVVTRGGDTEVLVATPLEKDWRGRPHILRDVTHALDDLDISILKADIGRHEQNDDEGWEIYRFLLADDECESPLTRSCTLIRIVDRLRQALSRAMQPYIRRLSSIYNKATPAG